MRLSNVYYSSPNYLGFNENGSFFSNDNVELDVAENQDPTYYFFKDFTLNEGHTLTTTKPCKGLYIYVSGTATVNGIITMTNRGIYSPPTGKYENGYTPIGMGLVKSIDNSYLSFSLPGKNELAAGSDYLNDSINGVNGGCGGGGAGQSFVAGAWAEGLSKSGSGGMAGVFGSGSGGGGGFFYAHLDWGTGAGYDAQPYAGPGGTGTSWADRYRCCGRGNGTVCYHTSAMNDPIAITEYTSGVLYFICNNLNITTDTTSAHFTSIGQLPTVHAHGGSDRCGGPCGGGSITILYRHTNIIPIINVSARFKLNTYKVHDHTKYTIYSGGNGSSRIQQIL